MKHNTKKFAILTSALLALGLPALVAAASAFLVRWEGTLKAVHSGETKGVVSLAPLENNAHIYAVGPVGDLDGEITTIAGKTSIARVRHNKIIEDSDFRSKASFLVWAEVAQWQAPVPLGLPAASHAELEMRIEQLAKSAGLNTDLPFPFLLEGEFEEVKFHVLAPKSDAHAHGSHTDAAKSIQLKNELATMIGFYSRSHEGVFTHRGSRVHLHVVTPQKGSGHVDELVTNANLKVSFPQ